MGGADFFILAIVPHSSQPLENFRMISLVSFFCCCAFLSYATISTAQLPDGSMMFTVMRSAIVAAWVGHCSDTKLDRTMSSNTMSSSAWKSSPGIPRNENKNLARVVWCYVGWSLA